MSAVLFVAEGEISPTKKKKKSPNFSPKTIFLRNFSSCPSTLCIATGGPAIVSDEIIENHKTWLKGKYQNSEK